MTAPNNPPGPGQPPVPGAESASPGPDGGPPHTQQAEGGWQLPSRGSGGGFGPAVYPSGLLTTQEKRPRHPGAEIRIGVLVALGSALVGLVVGLLWVWLAPRVPLYADSTAVYLKDPEGEQRAGGDGAFVLLGLAAGVVTALVAFMLTRRRGGGIAVAAGLAAGSLLGSVIAWRLGIALGPSSDIVAHARQVGQGKVFDAPLELGAKGALLLWPMAAMVLLLALTAAFGRREHQPLPYWQGGPVQPPSDRGSS